MNYRKSKVTKAASFTNPGKVHNIQLILCGYIRREEDFGFLFTNFQIGKIAKNIQHLHYSLYITIISLGKQ